MPPRPFRKPIRLPREAYANPENTFHVIINAVPGTAPFRGRVGDVVWEAVLAEANRGSVELLSACLMPGHLHVLVKPLGRDIVKWIDGFKSYTTYLARRAGGGPFLWQPGFYDR